MTPPAMHLTMTAAKTAAPTERPQLATVLVKFGEHILYRWEGTPERCDWYATGMRRRFPGLRVTDLDGNDWKPAP